MSSHSLLQGLFLTQGSNAGLPHCRWILCHLSHQMLHTWVQRLLPYAPGGLRGTAREEFRLSEEQQLLESAWCSKSDPQLHGAPQCSCCPVTKSGL